MNNYARSRRLWGAVRNTGYAFSNLGRFYRGLKSAYDWWRKPQQSQQRRARYLWNIGNAETIHRRRHRRRVSAGGARRKQKYGRF